MLIFQDNEKPELKQLLALQSTLYSEQIKSKTPHCAIEVYDVSTHNNFCRWRGVCIFITGELN